MKEHSKTKAQLLHELAELRQKVTDLEQSAASDRRARQELAQMRDTLSRSEEQFRQFVISISDHIYVTEITADGRHVNLYLSPHVETITGYPWEQFMAHWDFWPSTVIHPEDRARAANQALRQAQGQDSEGEYRLIRADGRIIWVRDSARVESKGSSRFVYGVVSDITERKRMEQEIRDRNRELNLLNRVITASVASQAAETLLEIVCRELAQALDLPLANATLLNETRTAAVVAAEYMAQDRPPALGRTISVTETVFQYLSKHKKPLVAAEARRDRRLASFRRVIEQYELASLLILPIIVKDEVIGSLNLGSGQPRRFSNGEVSLAWRVADQAAGALIRVQLSQAHHRLITAIEQATESFIITDTQGVMLYVNPAFERITGYRRQEAIGQNLDILKSDKYDEAFYEQLWATVRAGQVWHERFVRRRKDGSLYTVDATIGPVRDERGQIVNFVAVKRDVTAELLLEEQYRQAQKMEAVGRLAGGITHDFNNLLMAIMGNCDFILAGLSPADPFYPEVSAIKQAGESAASLTRQLLAFSRKQVLEPRVLNLNSIIINLEKMLVRLIGQDVTLVTRCDPDLGQVKADPGQLEQIIMNLVVNARDAMPRGGRLTIQTANINLEQAYAQSQAIPPGSYVLLAVSDTGIGMDEEILSHLFEPFFTTKEKGKGTGLGLATVYGIVTQSNGHLAVQSQPGQGSTFNIYLPRVEAPEEAVKPGPSPARSRPGEETILLIEDEVNVRLIVRKLLQKYGYKVLEAQTGQEAFCLGQQYLEPIDLVVADVILPEISGYDLVQRLLPLHPEMKVLYISGYIDDSITGQDVLGSEASFLQKPFTPSVLAHRIQELLGQA